MKGQKTGGRAPGTPNADRAAFLETLARLKCDPVELAARIAMGKHVFPAWDAKLNKVVNVPASPELQVRMIDRLLDKAVPTPKSVELTGPEGAPLVPPRIDYRNLPVLPSAASPPRASEDSGSAGRHRAPRVT